MHPEVKLQLKKKGRNFPFNGTIENWNTWNYGNDHQGKGIELQISLESYSPTMSYNPSFSNPKSMFVKEVLKLQRKHKPPHSYYKSPWNALHQKQDVATIAGAKFKVLLDFLIVFKRRTWTRTFESDGCARGLLTSRSNFTWFTDVESLLLGLSSRVLFRVGWVVPRT